MGRRDKLKLMNSTTVEAIIAIFITVSATYNAYILRGGKMAMSQVLMALGMISLVLSLVFTRFIPTITLIGRLTVADLFYIVGLVLLLSASIALRQAFK